MSELAARLRIPAGAKTAGIVTTRDGRPLYGPDDPIVNGSPGARVDNAATLRDDDPLFRWKQMDATMTHVEGHVAAMMRQPGGPQEAILIITQPPCRTREGCRRLLPAMLPRDAILHVYLRNKDGTATWFGSYTGNGRSMKR